MSAPIAGFRWNNSPATLSVVCEQCRALVALEGQQQHAEWHLQLRRLLGLP